MEAIGRDKDNNDCGKYSIEKFVRSDNSEFSPIYFSYNSTEYIDRGTISYPKSGETFYIKIKKSNVSSDVVSFTIKANFQYMIASGIKTIFEGEKDVDGDTIHQQNVISVDAIRTIYEQEITIDGGNLITKVDLDVKKKDGTKNIPLAGATITIYCEDGSVFGSKTTGSTGKVTFEGLTPGKYTCEETAAPDGYIRDKTIYSFEVKDDGEIVLPTIWNDSTIPNYPKGAIDIRKVDKYTKAPLAGAKIAIFDKLSGNKIQEVTTQAPDCIAHFEDLDSGEYKFKETQAPDGYKLNDTEYGFKIDDQGKITYDSNVVWDDSGAMIVIENEEKEYIIKGMVWEDKRQDNKETGYNGNYDSGESKVSGIKVELYNDDGTTLATGLLHGNSNTTTTDANGEYKFEGLPWSKKYLVKFYYNGQNYENTEYKDSQSMAREDTKDRDEYNKQFKEISSPFYELSEIDTDNNKPAVYKGTAHFGEIKANTDAYGKDDATGGTADIPEVELDFGIIERIKFDMKVQKDVYAATVKINGKTEVYGYDEKNLDENEWDITLIENAERTGYSRDLHRADYDFNGQNGNTDKLLEVYVTYKIAVRNQSMSMLGHVNALYDYYDASVFEYIPELSWQSDTNKKATKRNLEELRTEMIAGRTNGTKPNVTKQELNKLTIDVGKKEGSGDTEFIYLTFKIQKNSEGKVSTGKMYNKVEIGSFITYYKNGTVLPYYGTNNYTINNDTTIAGKVDRDSRPSSWKPDPKVDVTPVEDDESRAPALNVKTITDQRTIDGIVWEDERTQTVTIDGKDAKIGNGKKDSEEFGIQGVKVQLVEKLTINGVAKEYIWQEKESNNNGKYDFKGIIPGDYVIRFNYGNDGKTAATSANGGKNATSYNGQDYKSTTYQKGITQKDTTDLDGKYAGYKDYNSQNESGQYGYDIAEADKVSERVSDAKDIWTYREHADSDTKNKSIENELAEILASPYNDTSRIVKLIEKTAMIAETGVIVAEVERNMQVNPKTNEHNPAYKIENVDLGLVERPKAQMEIDKKISNIKMTLSDGSPFFDVSGSQDDVIWKTHEPYNLNSRKVNGVMYNAFYGSNHRYAFRDTLLTTIGGMDYVKIDKGLVQLTMDQELMHGATIEITYKIKVTNAGEVDYSGKAFYYLGRAEGGSIVRTSADQVVDYIPNNLQYNASKAENNGWAIINKTDLASITNSTIHDQINKFNNVIERKDWAKTGASNNKLLPGESTSEKTLVLSQLITPENTSDNLTYKNVVEIMSTTNEVGRRMAFSIVGNQDPTLDNASEVDSSMAEKVVILPPFGNTHIYYILGAVIAVILIGGIIFIIKKVNKK